MGWVDCAGRRIPLGPIMQLESTTIAREIPSNKMRRKIYYNLGSRQIPRATKLLPLDNSRSISTT